MRGIPSTHNYPSEADSRDILQGICYPKNIIAPTIPDNFDTRKIHILVSLHPNFASLISIQTKKPYTAKVCGFFVCWAGLTLSRSKYWFDPKS